MKYLFLIFVTFPVFACQIKVPISEAQRYLDAMPSGVPPLFKCDDKPDEKCHCTDNIIWETAELATVFTQDEFGINIESKELRESPVRKAAYESEKIAEIDLARTKEENKQSLKLLIKEDIKTATTVAKLKAIIEKMIEVQE